MTDGIFTVRSTYNELVCLNNSHNIPFFDSIWHWKGLQRISLLSQIEKPICHMGYKHDIVIFKDIESKGYIQIFGIFGLYDYIQGKGCT